MRHTSPPSANYMRAAQYEGSRTRVFSTQGQAMTFDNIIVAVFAVIFGLFIGNYMGDQATLRDCATKQQARMVSGGVVSCEVKKEKP